MNISLIRFDDYIAYVQHVKSEICSDNVNDSLSYPKNAQRFAVFLCICRI